jgi:long-chain acyl-CoA synthetase
MLARESRLIGPGSPFELIDSTLDGITYRTYRHAPNTLNDVYRRAARFPDHELLIQCNSRLNNATVLQRAAALGLLLKDAFQIADGMCVGVSLDNRPEWLIAFIAVTSINATAVILPGDLGPADAASALGSSDCTMVITDKITAEQLASCGFRGSTLAIDIDDDYEGDAFANCVAKSNSEASSPYSPVPDPEQLAMIAFTSGSSGPPKGVRINHRGLMQGMMNMLLGAALNAARMASNHKAARVTSAPISILTAPFSHVSGYSHLFLMLFLNGTVFALPEWDPAVARSVVKREAITTLSGATPQMVRDLISHAPLNGELDSLRSIGIHGVSLMPSLVTEITAQLPQVTINTGYGMTETNGTICTIAGPELAQRHNSCGRALPTVEIRIVPDVNKAEPGGEILVRGAMLMQGYCGPFVGSHKAVGNEWFKTGDWGRIDDEVELTRFGTCPIV